MYIDFNNTHLLYLVICPATLFLILYIFNILLFLRSIKESTEVGTLDNNQIKGLFPQFIVMSILFGTLMSIGVVYGFILYIETIESPLMEADLFIFLIASAITIIFKNIIFYFFLRVLRKNDKKLIHKALSFSILGISIAEIPAIGGLIYIFSIIGK